jgi:hypothetical protein
LDSATTVASFMEGYWGMGKTVSSAASSRRLEAGTPGGVRGATAGTAAADAKGPSPLARLADRIEDNLGLLLTRAEEILRDNDRHVLALAHALETHKTLSGEDVTAVFEGTRGPLVDGSPYADDAFIAKLREYHLAAKRAHHEHNQPQVSIPVATPAYVVTIPETYLNGNGSSAGNGYAIATGTTEPQDDVPPDVIDFGGLSSGNGSGNGSSGNEPLSAPTYDPPEDSKPDQSGDA